MQLSGTGRPLCRLTSRAAAWRIQWSRTVVAGWTPAASTQLHAQQTVPEQDQQQHPVYYSNYPLDRAAALRQDPAAVSELFGSARLLPVAGSKALVVQPQQQQLGDNTQQGMHDATDLAEHAHAGSNGTSSSTSNSNNGSSSNGAAKLRLAWVHPAEDVAEILDAAYEPIFLGLDAAGAAYFAGQVQQSAADALAASRGAHWEVARTAGPDLPETEAALAAVATGLAQFHRANLFAGATGQRMESTRGGFARAVVGSRRAIYPRMDPAIITLITAGDWCLLGRKAGWPAGRYSTLAGFLEMGETLEQALCREVEEESGVRVNPASVRYIASQPWPFPQSLMVGFYAEAALKSSSSTSGFDLLTGPARSAAVGSGIRPEVVAEALLPELPTPVPQADEMEDVRWFHRDWLQHVLHHTTPAEGSFNIPSSYSLANRLVLGWLPTQQCQQPQDADAAAAWEAAEAQLSQVSIDIGTFKYVLLRLTQETTGRSRLLVWGHTAAAYHNDILQRCKARAQKLGLSVEVLGGGRIAHDPMAQTIDVYGYSAAYGPACHEVSAALLRRWHPFYRPEAITISYEGY